MCSTLAASSTSERSEPSLTTPELSPSRFSSPLLRDCPALWSTGMSAVRIVRGALFQTRTSSIHRRELRCHSPVRPSMSPLSTSTLRRTHRLRFEPASASEHTPAVLRVITLAMYVPERQIRLLSPPHGGFASTEPADGGMSSYHQRPIVVFEID